MPKELRNVKEKTTIFLKRQNLSLQTMDYGEEEGECSSKLWANLDDNGKTILTHSFKKCGVPLFIVSKARADPGFHFEVILVYESL
jgi:hypothetical protein